MDEYAFCGLGGDTAESVISSITSGTQGLIHAYADEKASAVQKVIVTGGLVLVAVVVAWQLSKR